MFGDNKRVCKIKKVHQLWADAQKIHDSFVVTHFLSHKTDMHR